MCSALPAKADARDDNMLIAAFFEDSALSLLYTESRVRMRAELKKLLQRSVATARSHCSVWKRMRRVPVDTHVMSLMRQFEPRARGSTCAKLLAGASCWPSTVGAPHKLARARV